MKKILILFCIILSSIFVACEEEFRPLDEIHEYSITINSNDDGTLNMLYYLKWEVLEEGDGGVDFITVGVANRFVENIKGLTDNIKDIYYSSENGATIRIDLKETYHAGDIFEVKFSFRQERIFVINDNFIQYSFNPGWFNEIQVKKLVVLWASKNVLKNNADENILNYYKWETSLDYGETIDVNLLYDRSNFPNLNPKEDYSDQTINPWLVLTIFAIMLLIVTIIVIISKASGDKYQTCRGFSGNIRSHHFYFGRYHGYRRSGKEIVPQKVVNGGGTGVNGSGCACACACACAGGGRAGCSRKDFNNHLKME